MTEYIIEHTTPRSEDLIHLRSVCALRPPPPDKVAAAISAPLHCVKAKSPSGEAVGMVRAIGDGHVYVQIVDMAVHPDHQRRGLGKHMLKGMVEWIDRECEDVYTSLIAMPGSQGMYRREGFVETGGREMKRTTWPKPSWEAQWREK